MPQPARLPELQRLQSNLTSGTTERVQVSYLKRMESGLVKEYMAQQQHAPPVEHTPAPVEEMRLPRNFGSPPKRASPMKAPHLPAKRRDLRPSGRIDIFHKPSTRHVEIDDMDAPILRSPSTNRKQRVITRPRSIIKQGESGEPPVAPAESGGRTGGMKPSLVLLKKKMRERKNQSSRMATDESIAPADMTADNHDGNRTHETSAYIPAKYVSKSPAGRRRSAGQKRRSTADRLAVEQISAYDGGSSSRREDTQTRTEAEAEKPFTFLKRKTKKMEPQKIDFSRVHTRVKCWNTERGERHSSYRLTPEKPPNRLVHEMATLVKPLSSIAKDKSRTRIHLKSPVPRARRAPTKFFKVQEIRNTYLNSYLVKFREVGGLPDVDRFSSTLR